MTIGQKLIHLRNVADMSQEQLSEALGVSRQSISKWEMDQALPQIEKVIQLAEIFGVTTDELLLDRIEINRRPANEPRKLKYFGTDGFRGEANVNLTSMQAYKVGRFLGWYFSSKLSGCTKPGYRPRIVIGKDTRRSSYMFEYSLVAGLTASGADVYLMHVTPTPSVSYIVRADEFDSESMLYGKERVLAKMNEIDTLGNAAAPKDKNMYPILELVLEMNERGIDFMKKIKNLKVLEFDKVPISNLNFLYDLPKLKEFTMRYTACDETALECIETYKPHVVLLDINMPVMDGLKMLEVLRNSPWKNQKVIILTIHNEIEYLMKAIEIGIDGYVLKDADSAVLKQAIITVNQGDEYIDYSMIPLLKEKWDMIIKMELLRLMRKSGKQQRR